MIRPAERGDIEAIARLYIARFLRGNSHKTQAVCDYLEQALFCRPHHIEGIHPLVALNRNGDFAGFVNIVPWRALMMGRPIIVAGFETMMAFDRADPLVGARLLREGLAGSQDLSVGETANAVSVGLWQKLGAQDIPALSLDWIKPLQPIGFGLEFASSKFGVLRHMRPIARACDLALHKLKKRDARLHPDKRMDLKLLDLEAYKRQWNAAVQQEHEGDVLASLLHGALLVPHVSSDELQWRVNCAGARESTLQIALMKDKPVGAFMLLGQKGEIARCLMFAADDAFKTQVFAAMIGQARERGCVGVRGRSWAGEFEAAALAQCFFQQRFSFLAHSLDPEILAAVQTGNVVLTGLYGMLWDRLVRGAF